MRDGSADAKAALVRPGRYQHRARQPRVKEVTPRRRRPRGSGSSSATTRPRPSATGPSGEAQIDRISAEIARLEDRNAAEGQDRHGPPAAHPRPSASCATTRRSRPLPARRPRPAGHGSTAPRSPPRSASTASSCISTSDPTHQRRGRRARLQEPARGRTLLPRPQGHPPSCARSSTASSNASAPTSCICWLALLLVRVAERQAHDTWRNLRRELERLHLVTLQGDAGPSARPPSSPPASARSSTSSSSNRPRGSPASHPPRPDPSPAHARGHTRGKRHKPLKPASAQPSTAKNVNPCAHQLRKSGEPLRPDTTAGHDLEAEVKVPSRQGRAAMLSAMLVRA